LINGETEAWRQTVYPLAAGNGFKAVEVILPNDPPVDRFYVEK